MEDVRVLIIMTVLLLMMITLGDSMPSRLGAGFSSTATGVAFGGGAAAAELDFAFFRGITDFPQSTVWEALG